jgi:hypothetical protein
MRPAPRRIAADEPKSKAAPLKEFQQNILSIFVRVNTA